MRTKAAVVSASSRQIAKVLGEQSPFMWLAGCETAGFRTGNRFRGERMKGRLVDEILAEVVQLSLAERLVTLKGDLLDGPTRSRRRPTPCVLVIRI